MTKIYEDFHKNTKAQKQIIPDYNFTYRIILPIINSYFKMGGKVILDIGCGSGTISLYLSSLGNRVHGIDISKKAILSCKKSAKDLMLNNASFEILDFPSKKIEKSKYDSILLLEVIEHIQNHQKALELITQALKPGGLLILSTPSKNAPLYKLGLLSNFDSRVGHLRRYSENEITTLIKSSGLSVIKVIKNEGILRNFLFTNKYAGQLVRLIKFQLVDIVSFLDKLSLRFFGESDFIVIALKK